jgi:hypothetical protein
MEKSFISRTLGFALCVAASTLTFAPTASADTPRVERNERDSRWVTGTVEVAAAPEALLGSLRAVSSWPSLFGDITSLALKTRNGDRQVATVHSKILGDHAHEFTVEARGDRVDIVIDITGVVTRGSFVVAPGAQEGTSRVSFSLYAAKSGIGGLFVSEGTLRGKQQAIVRTYLADLSRVARPSARR